MPQNSENILRYFGKVFKIFCVKKKKIKFDQKDEKCRNFGKTF